MSAAILKELKKHVPFTVFGTLSGIAVMAVAFFTRPDHPIYEKMFWISHPFHVFLSALVTVGMYKLHGRGDLPRTFLIGYFGSIGIGTLSDCIIPYVGESLLGLPNRDIHLGFIEKWWLVNSLAFAGIVLAYLRPSTKFPHAGHVLLSTWASLFHMIMAVGSGFSSASIFVIPVFLFLAVWIPCCTSDIVFPLLFVAGDKRGNTDTLQEPLKRGKHGMHPPGKPPMLLMIGRLSGITPESVGRRLDKSYWRWFFLSRRSARGTL